MGGVFFELVEVAVRELALLAGVGFLILGASDLAVDLLWLGRTSARLLTGNDRGSADKLRAPRYPGRLAVFVPAWDEAAVIGQMLNHAVETFDHPDYCIYVGCYPNDPQTIEAVRTIRDPRVRLVINDSPGPTTKADCLNAIWRGMIADEERGGAAVKAVVLHDAEDVVHSAELRIFDTLIEDFDLVQLPVLPLIDRDSRWIAGHYADEFAEEHGKALVVREVLGASLPSAGVGCAFSRSRLATVAERIGTGPFDPDSLTEDYELGLRMREGGGRSRFVRLPSAQGRRIVVTREYFPATIEAAVAQKARWMAGIALSGWDRLGWSGGIAERWMRLRDRQSVIAAVFVLAGYAAILLFAVLECSGPKTQAIYYLARPR